MDPINFKYSGNKVKLDIELVIHILQNEAEHLVDDLVLEYEKLSINPSIGPRRAEEMIEAMISTNDGIIKAFNNRQNRLIADLEKEMVARPVNDFAASHPDQRFDWVLGFVKTSHCSDCIKMSKTSQAEGPKTIKEWRAYGVGLPREGQTECSYGCQCMLRPADGKQEPDKKPETKPKFTPAKTVAEAEEWAKKQSSESIPYASNIARFSHVGKKFGVVRSGFDYSDLTLEQSNKLNNLLNESNLICDKLKIPRLQGFSTKTGKTKNTASLGDGVMYFNKKYLNSFDDKTIELIKERFKKENIPLSAPDSYIIEKGKLFDNSFWHEFGHHIHQQFNVKDKISYKAPPLEKILNEKFNLLMRNKTSLTKYGRSNSLEYFAEHFSLYKIGFPLEKLPKEFIEIIKELGL